MGSVTTWMETSLTIKGERMQGVHRADYMLERGVWRATCRVCGYSITDPVRRRAMSAYRSHIRESSGFERDSDQKVTIDLRQPAGVVLLPGDGAI